MENRKGQHRGWWEHIIFIVFSKDCDDTNTQKLREIGQQGFCGWEHCFLGERFLPSYFLKQSANWFSLSKVFPLKCSISF